MLIFPIFQSTLPREERPQAPYHNTDMLHYFNPRSHERSDLCPLILLCIAAISIHAPTRGATVAVAFHYSIYPDFNPRSHERSDKARKKNFWEDSQYFHPRSHERSDGTAKTATFTGYVFQSTLPREERQAAGAGQDADNNFNPRSHERSDPLSPCSAKSRQDFNPRSHERSDDLRQRRAILC